MLRQDLKSAIPPEENAVTPTPQPVTPQAARASDSVQRLDIQQSLDILEELILESPRVPLSRRTLVDEDKLLEQLDRIRLNLPSVFQEATHVLQQRDRILGSAEQQAQAMLNEVEHEAARRLQEMGIVQRAEEQARQVQHKLQQECETLRSQTMAEIEQWQETARQHWETTKQQAESECAAMKQEADVYAAQVLQRVEHQLSEMLRVVYNGRRSLTGETARPADRGRPSSPPTTSRTKALPQSEITRSGRPQRRVE